MKTFYQLRIFAMENRYIFWIMATLSLMACDNHNNEIPVKKIYKAKPIQKFPEKEEIKIAAPPDSVKFPTDSLQQIMKDTTETIQIVPKKQDNIMPRRFFNLNIYKKLPIS